MVIKNSKSRTEYYQEYYLQHKDRYKYLYYSKKLADEKRLEFFKEWGSERKYYENYYKDWNNLQLKK